jgi:hypothetical protein
MFRVVPKPSYFPEAPDPVLGGLVLLALYSLLVMSQRGDACLDQRELERLKNHQAASSLVKSGKSANLRVSAASDFYHGGIT